MTPKKVLGQHFLVSEKVVASILEAIQDPGGILEIGPGPGVLTQRMQDLAPVLAVDLDFRVEDLLRDSAPMAKFIEADILKCNLSELLSNVNSPRWIVSNLPYNISSAVLSRICGIKDLLAGSVLMMQKEVADRVTASPGNSDRGSLSVAVQLRFEVSRICNVPQTAFLPPPKVESTVLALQPKPDELVKGIDSLLKSGFTQPRKTLVNNLCVLMQRQSAEQLVTLCGLDLRVRPHALTNEEWLDLASRWSSQSS